MHCRSREACCRGNSILEDAAQESSRFAAANPRFGIKSLAVEVVTSLMQGILRLSDGLRILNLKDFLNAARAWQFVGGLLSA